MSKVIVAGGRDFENYEWLREVLDNHLTIGDIIISGTAKGADTLGEKYAEQRTHEIMKFPAEWEKYGKSAGPIRNRQMALVSDKLVAFLALSGSKGTKNMIETALKKGLEVHVYRY